MSQPWAAQARASTHPDWGVSALTVSFPTIQVWPLLGAGSCLHPALKSSLEPSESGKWQSSQGLLDAGWHGPRAALWDP